MQWFIQTILKVKPVATTPNKRPRTLPNLYARWTSWYPKLEEATRRHYSAIKRILMYNTLLVQ